MRPYIVRDGEYLALIAARHDFDADSVWQDEQNRDLRDRRHSPNVLAPGDVLHIPDPPEPSLSLSPQTTNRFRGAPPRVEVKIRLELGDRALAGERCVITGTMSPIEATTDGDGQLELLLPSSVGEVDIEVPARRLRFRCAIGRLNPHDHRDGTFERLVNLGYIAPEERHATEEQRRARVRSALAAFKRDRGETPADDAELTEDDHVMVRDHHGA